VPIVVYFFFPSFWYIAVIVVSYTLISQVLSGLFSGYSFEGKSIQLRKSTLSIRTYITSQSKIEEFSFSQSLLQRILGLSSFSITTRENPAKVTKMSDVPFEVSKTFYERYREQSVYVKKHSA